MIDTSEAMENSHPPTRRLFLGIPVAPKTGALISSWAKEVYDSAAVRFVECDQMQVTLAFFPNTPHSEIDLMIGLASKIEWNRLQAVASRALITKQGALALSVDLDESDLDLLADKLLRFSNLPCDRDPQAPSRLEEPLGMLTWMQDNTAHQARWRDDRHGRPLKLHLTFARPRKGIKIESLIGPPSPVILALEKVNLYESHLFTSGVRHEILATSHSS